jgi:hypothetical protein
MLWASWGTATPAVFANGQHITSSAKALSLYPCLPVTDYQRKRGAFVQTMLLVGGHGQRQPAREGGRFLQLQSQLPIQKGRPGKRKRRAGCRHHCAAATRRAEAARPLSTPNLFCSPPLSLDGFSLCKGQQQSSLLRSLALSLTRR